ncbi:MAG: prephenate dehydratase domain-containing protein, partial [Balneolales bacterium]
GETYLRISHHLIALPGVKYEELSEVLSHPMAIQQTRVYLRTLGIKVTEHEDTAGAVADIKKGNRRDLAAVASMRAAELYGMNILKQNIETDPNNYTRFLLISGKEANEFKPDQTLKTSLLFGFSDGPGALVEILQIFAEAEINMTKIESRPRLGSPWRYDFYVDLEMDSRSEPAKRILAKLSSKTSFLRILGTYPLLNGDY